MKLYNINTYIIILFLFTLDCFTDLNYVYEYCENR